MSPAQYIRKTQAGLRADAAPINTDTDSRGSVLATMTIKAALTNSRLHGHRCTSAKEARR